MSLEAGGSVGAVVYVGYNVNKAMETWSKVNDNAKAIHTGTLAVGDVFFSGSHGFANITAVQKWIDTKTNYTVYTLEMKRQLAKDFLDPDKELKLEKMISERKKELAAMKENL